ncbi:glycerol-3-phosphate acyltransferase PlsX [Spiroplasma helicoides]|uniref:Phosphate acyltransferase n=1 Tax=Spiroplasma helicoides TaxID=216938 RepID=A0A1B3SLB3_9MOLU|nr:phosphate acyltransferase PlsX [Spiroplasma helicoides]AOG60713.1 glycerol-3-phosphate acyltransferase PlsX [Spiroplasma helicoides]
MEYIKIAFDVMGSDKGLVPAIDAALRLISEKKDLKIILVGLQKDIKKELSKRKYNHEQIEIHNATEVIEMVDGIMDIRRKKDSSMVRSLEIVRDGIADGVTSGGATAPFIAGCIFILKRIEGIERPAFMPVMPTIIKDKVVLLLDAGANLECDADDILKFAIMASSYSKSVKGVESPKVALLNVGEEESKGLEFHKESYKVLKNNKNIEFIGNLEPRYMCSGIADIVVTDGYTGNIALKAIEGIGKNLLSEIKVALTKNLWRKLAALRLRKAFKEVSHKFDYRNHAGAIVLGVDKIAFKSHGSSDKVAFYASLKMTYDAIKNDVLNKVKAALENK